MRSRLAVKPLIWATLALCLLGGALRFAYPSEVPLIFDEALLLHRALDDNSAGVWTTYGLRGSRGVDYGPVPILFYRGLLALTHDPVTLALGKIASVTFLTALAVWLLLRTCPWIPPWTAVFVFCSPYFWNYARDLWDNSLNIPLTALYFSTYVAFLATHKKRWYAVSVLLGATALQVHLMVLPLVLALASHFVLFEKRWWKKQWLAVLAIHIVAALLLAPYLWHFLTTSRTPLPLAPGLAMFQGVFGLLGGRVFTALGFEYFFGPYWYGVWGALPMAITAVALVCVFAGMGRAWTLVKMRRQTLETSVAWICLVGLALHVLIATVQQLTNHPHYYSSVWILFFCFLGMGLARLGGRRLWKALGIASGLGLFLSLANAAAFAHAGKAESRPHYGRFLSLQMKQARASCSNPPESQTQSPQALLRRLLCSTSR